MGIEEQIALQRQRLRKGTRTKDRSKPVLQAEQVVEIDEKSYHATILDFNIEQWLDLLPAGCTAYTELCPIAMEDARTLMRLYEHVHLSAKDPASMKEKDQARIGAMQTRLQDVIDRVRGMDTGVFIKTSSRSAKNASSADPERLREVYNVLMSTSSDTTTNGKIMNLLRAGTLLLQTASARECLQVFAHSERIYNDMDIAMQSPHRFVENFVVRKWVPLDCVLEFRCWVVEGRLVAVSQYSNLVCVPELVQHSAAIIQQLQTFFSEYCSRQLAHKYPRYVVDFGFEEPRQSILARRTEQQCVAAAVPLPSHSPSSSLPAPFSSSSSAPSSSSLPPSHSLPSPSPPQSQAQATANADWDCSRRVWLIELNPFLPTTDPGLFCWSKDHKLLNGQETELGFKFLTEAPLGAAGGLLDEWKAIIS